MAELPANPEPDDTPFSSKDLIELAEDSNRGSDLIASITSFLGVGLPVEKALEMLGIGAEEARKRLAEIHKRQAEVLRSNTESMRTIGHKVIGATALLNPLRYLKKH